MSSSSLRTFWASALDLTMPASKHLFIVQNDCGQDMAVTTGAGA
jgi:hypothetical protein